MMRRAERPGRRVTGSKPPLSIYQQIAAALGADNRLLLDDRQQNLPGGGVVNPWLDQSGYGSGVSQSDNTKRPATGLTINTWPAPDFNGSSSRMDGALLSAIVSAGSWHMFAVVQLDSHVAADGNGDAGSLILADTDGFFGLSVSVSGVQAFLFDGGAYRRSGLAGYAAISDGSPTLIEAWCDGPNIACRTGSAAALSSAGGSIAAAGLTKNICVGDRGASGKLDGRIGFLSCNNALLPAGNVTALRSLLGVKYNVPV